MPRYRLDAQTDENGLRSIIATETFTPSNGVEVTAGTTGGKVSGMHNLDMYGTSWIFAGAIVQDDAYVSGKASVFGTNTVISDEAKIYGSAQVGSGNNYLVKIQDNARVLGKARFQAGKMGGEAVVSENALVRLNEGDITDDDTLQIKDNARVQGYARLKGDITIQDSAAVYGTALIKGQAVFKDNAIVSGNMRIPDSIEGVAVTGVVVEKNGRVFGCAELRKNAVLTDNAVVYGDKIIEDTIITDAGLVTTCPDKVDAGCDTIADPSDDDDPVGKIY